MNEAVLDASAILALVQQEPGAENLIDEVLMHAVASTVNLVEVQSKLVKKGIPPDEAWFNAVSAIHAEAPFTSEQAKIASTLIARTEQYGLSLGDRACLALAITLNAPVYTTEQIWRNLDLGIPIHVIR